MERLLLILEPLRSMQPMVEATAVGADGGGYVTLDRALNVDGGTGGNLTITAPLESVHTT